MAKLLLRNPIVYTLSFLLSASSVLSQASRSGESVDAAEIYWSLQKLNTLGRALYLAAHPDDENTNLISYLSLGRQYDTAYLSLTRGDGGQNLIGPEIRDALGVIRTQELLEARKIDGGAQYFTRAKDFGYSKNPDETFRIWDRYETLSDVVWVIRKFQPDVIVTRFNPEPGYTHGHHTASTMLALEAFEAAADPDRFVEQLEFVQPWQVKRVFWNASSWHFRNSGQAFEKEEYLELEVGGYDSLLGKSYNEVASASRSMHRSQGFGTSIDRGSRLEYFKLLAGDRASVDLFDGVDTSWRRVEGGEAIESRVEKIIDEFSLADPSASIASLIELRKSLGSLEESAWARSKREEVDGIILACLGAHLRLRTNERYVRNGETVEVMVEAINRSDAPARLVGVSFPFAGTSHSLDLQLSENERIEAALETRIPSSAPLPQPYWLESEGSLGMFDVSEQALIGQAENAPTFSGSVQLEVDGELLELSLPLVYQDVDPAFGERIKEVLNLPEAALAFDSEVTLFPNYEARELSVTVSALMGDVAGTLELVLPEGWESKPSKIEKLELPRGTSNSYRFEVRPRSVSEEVTIGAILKTPSGAYSKSLARIEYPHIREQTIFKPTETRAVSLDVSMAGRRVAYLAGAGDSVPDSIREIGFEVIELSPSEFRADDLEGVDTVVIGIRALNTIDNIGPIMDSIFEFVEAGGTAITQYNTSHRLKTETVAPYPLTLSRDRVTDETADMRVLVPEHAVLNSPNRITENDFKGWTQERGLYFPNKWDEAFTPIFSVNDPGEGAKEGSLLVARYGKGYYVYTGLSWFRQLPAGVPGAYRLFANLLSLGHESSSVASKP